MQDENESMNPLEGDQTPDTERQFYSVGFLCSMLQIPPAAIRALMQEAGVEFAYSVNDCGYVRGDDVVKMHHASRSIQQEIENKQASHANN